MNDSPAILKSFIAPVALAQHIEHVYGLAEVRCQLIKATMRDMYDVRTTDQRFAAGLYRYRPQGLASIRAEIQIIQHIHKAGIATARPIPTKSGNWLTALSLPEGTRYLVLFEWLTGEPFPRQPTSAQIQSYGTQIGRLHTTLDMLPIPLQRLHRDADMLLAQPLAHLRKILHLPTETLTEIEEATRLLSEQLTRLPIDTPQFGLIHGDVIPSNALMYDNNALQLIDFDLCGYGWRMMDVATFLNEASFWSMGDAASEAFMAGYQAQRPISDAERRWLPLFGAARNIWTLGNAASHVNIWGRHLYLSEHVITGEMTSLRAHLSRLPS